MRKSSYIHWKRKFTLIFICSCLWCNVLLQTWIGSFSSWFSYWRAAVQWEKNENESFQSLKRIQVFTSNRKGATIKKRSSTSFLWFGVILVLKNSRCEMIFTTLVTGKDYENDVDSMLYLNWWSGPKGTFWARWHIWSANAISILISHSVQHFIVTRTCFIITPIFLLWYDRSR